MAIALPLAIAMPLAAATYGLAVPSILKLLNYEWLLDKKVKAGLASLRADLESMHAFLGDVTSLAPDLQLSLTVKLQYDEASDLSHSIGTCLHSFVVRIESSLTELFINHEIEQYIDDTRIKVKEHRERYGSYPSKSSLESTCTQKPHPRILAKYKRVSNPVGIAGATAHLTNMLLSEDNHAIVSIVGMGGIGKTTLAQAVYDKMKGDFEWKAFVLIGQEAGPEKVLKDIFDGLGVVIRGNEPDQHQLADQLQTLLVLKRCLIVFDDIWEKDIWDLIKYVCEDSAGSKIITTTRNRKIAENIGGIYEIKPLNRDDSMKLLRTKATAKSDDTEFDSLSDKILRKCVGVPMAITVIGSFLATKPRSEWNSEYDRIGFGEHEINSVFEVITKVMRYSYTGLPSRIQNCFLYLSLFPKDHWIDKNMLIWRWVAEGLVPDKLFETGDSYLKELINRSMLQWAVSPRDVGQGGCRVHSLMFDLIRDLSSSQEQNFSTVLDMKQESTSQTRPIHRLAIHGGQNQINNSLNVGEVKSFYASRSSGGSFPPLQNFEELCVIDLEDCNLGDCKLEELGSKSLEYVGLLDTGVVELPVMIGRLKLLQTLDVTATGIGKIPKFVEELVKLRCLRSGKGTCMMGRVWKLTSLEELWLYSADKSPDFAVGLQKLSQMRVLVIHFDEIHDSMQEALIESLHDLKKLQVLQVWSDAAEGKVRLDCWEVCVPSPELRQLLLFGVILPRLAPWIHPSRVPKLSKLLLEVDVLKAQDLNILGQMPSLHSLYLHCKEYKCLSYTASKDEFKVLEYLSTNIEFVCGDGALPSIQELEVGNISVGTDVGLEGNMPLLGRASYHLNCYGYGLAEIEKTEAALMQASQAHHNRPILSIKRFNNYNIPLEVQHQNIECMIPDIVARYVAVAFPEFGEAQANASSNASSSGCSRPDLINIIIGSIERSMLAVGAPPTLTVGVAIDGIGSLSQSTPQFAGGVPPRRPTGEDQVLLTTTTSIKDIINEHKNHSPAVILSIMEAHQGINAGDTALFIRNTAEKCAQNPEFIAFLSSVELDRAGAMSESDMYTMLKLFLQEAISPAAQDLGGPTRGSETSARPAGTEKLSIEHDADSILDRVDSVMADKDVVARLDNLYADIAVPGITAKDGAVHARKVFKKTMQNPEFVAKVKSLKNKGGSGPSFSDMFELMKPVLSDLMCPDAIKTEGPGRGAGTDANCSDGPSSMFAENYETDVSYETLPEIDNPDGVDFNMEELFRLANDPVGYTRVLENCMRKPEMIASINRMPRTGDTSEIIMLMIQLMVPEAMAYFDEQRRSSSMPSSNKFVDLVRDPAFASIISDIVVGCMGSVASSTPSVPQGAGVASDSTQDGEDFSRTFNLKELLPAVQQALGSGTSSGQTSSVQPDNVGIEEGDSE